MKKKLILFLGSILISVQLFGQVTVVGTIGAVNASDFPTHLDVNGKGGLMAVTTLAERDAIPQLRRSPGMLVSVTNMNKIYQLVGGTLNSNWQDFANLGDGNVLDKILSTGVDSRVRMVINSGNASRFDIPAFTATFVDQSTGVVSKLNYAGSTANIVTNISTQDATYIAIDKNGTIYQTPLPQSPQMDRDRVSLGVLVHQNRTEIGSIAPFTYTPTKQLGSAISEISRALGAINNGNVYGAHPTLPLKISKTSGTTTLVGINAFDNVITNSPNITVDNPQSAPFFIYTWRNGTGGWNTAITDNINPSRFDNNTGGQTEPNGVLSTNKWQIHKIFWASNDVGTIIQYGQKEYNTYADAVNGISNDAVTDNPSLSGAFFRSWLLVRGGATDLKISPADAQFREAPKLQGLTGSGAGSSGGTIATLQTAYDNSVDGKIIMNGTKNAGIYRQDGVTKVAEFTNAGDIVTQGAISATGTITGANPTTGSHLTTKTYVDNGLATKENTITAGTTGQYYRGDKTFQTLDKAAVGLSNVDNTSDANKPVSAATQTALNLKANLSGANFTGNVTTDGILTTGSGITDGFFRINGLNSGLVEFQANSGGSVNYNGLAINSNKNNSNNLPNWELDLGGYDAPTYSSDIFEVRRKPFGGSFSRFLTIRNNGYVGVNNINPSERLSVTGNILATGTIVGSNLVGFNTGDQTITLTGDVTGSGTGTFGTNLSNTGVSAGTYTQVTVDAKGRVTSGSNPVTTSWSLTGNAGTNASTNFIGTTDNTDLTFRVNNVRAGRIGRLETSNLSLGVSSHNALTSGVANTAIGAESGFNLTTGTGNTFIGYNAGRNVTNSGFNTFVGVNAGFNIVGTGGNTLIGEGTNGSFGMVGCTAIGQTIFFTGGYSNSTGVGANATVTASNQVFIGSNSISQIGGFANWTNYSDGRIKTNVKENVKGLDFILKLRPVTYNLKLSVADSISGIIEVRKARLKSKGFPKLDTVKTAIVQTKTTKKGKSKTTTVQKTIQPLSVDAKLMADLGVDEVELKAIKEKEAISYTGFIAQEVEQAAKQVDYDFSGIVKPQNEKDMYKLSYAEFVVPLVKAIQEQQAQIKELKEKINLLESGK